MEMRGARETALLVAVLVALSRGVDGPPLWAGAALIVGVAATGTIHLLGEWRFWRVASRLALPALAAFAAVGGAHLLPVPWLVVVAPAVVAGVEWAIRSETPAAAVPAAATHVEEPPREEFAQLTLDVAALDVATLANPADRPASERAVVPEDPASGQAATPGAPPALDETPVAPSAGRVALRAGALGLGFLAFTAVGGVVPNGIGGSGTALSAATLLATVALDAVVGALVGYRLVVLGGVSGRAAAAQTNHYLAIAAHLGALFRVLELPRLVGPALLIAALYLWSELRHWRASRAAIPETPQPRLALEP